MGLKRQLDRYTLDYILNGLTAEIKRLEKISEKTHGEDTVKDVCMMSYLANMDWVISFVKSLKLSLKN